MDYWDNIRDLEKRAQQLTGSNPTMTEVVAVAAEELVGELEKLLSTWRPLAKSARTRADGFINRL